MRFKIIQFYLKLLLLRLRTPAAELFKFASGPMKTQLFRLAETVSCISNQ